MKSNWHKCISSAITFLVLLPSCEEQDINVDTSIDIEKEELLTHFAIFDLVLNDLEVLTLDVLSDLEERDPTGSAFTHIDSYLFVGRGSCAEITNDFDLNLITIDFGNGCIDNKGVYREGTIEISYDHADNRVGNSIRTVLTDYKFQGQEFIGAFTITRLPNIEFDDAYQLSFTDMQLSIAENNLVLSGLLNQRLIQQNNYETMFVEKSSDGIFNGNINISSNTSSSVGYSSDCFNEDVYMANVGVDNIVLNGSSFQLSYSQEIDNGQVISSCDYIISLSDYEEKKSQIDLRSFLSQ